MKFKRTTSKPCGANASRGGFTLVEVLAALLFMAIVIPSAVEGLRLANLAGQVGQRKAVAARIAESVLNERIVMRQWQNASQSGTVQEGVMQYRWQLRTEPWNQQTISGGTTALSLMTVQVNFPVQGRDYDVRLSTLIDTTLQ